MSARLAGILGLVLAIPLAGCNPNFGLGTGAPDEPTDWAAPPMSGEDPHAGHDHAEGAHGDDPHAGMKGMPSLETIRKALNSRIAENPKDLDAHLQLGQLLAEQGAWDEALAILATASEIDPKQVESRVIRANILLQKKDEDGAKEELEAASKQAPDDESVLRAWGGYYLMVEDIDRAIAVRKKLLAKYPDVEDAENLELWNFYLARIPELKDKDQVKQFFDLLGAGARQNEAGRHAEAVATFKKALALVPDDPYLLASLGAAQHASGSKAEGTASFEKALRLDEKNGKARLGYAEALAAGGDFKAAAAVMERWKKLDPRRAKRNDVDAILAKLANGEMFEVGRPKPSSVAAHGGSAHAPPPDERAAPPVAAGESIQGSVTIDPRLASKVRPGATLFLFGKLQPGAGPPLVAIRRTVTEFPFRFSLTKNEVMQPGMPFDGPLYLTARIDADGVAGAGPGDLEGSSAAVEIGSTDVTLVIDTAR